MGLFTKSDHELASLRNDWRGRLSEEMWSSDADHRAYVETAEELLVQYATLGLQTKAKGNLPAEINRVMNKLLPVFAPLSADVPTLADTAITAFLSSSAESWSELDRDEVARLASQGWERFQRDNPESSHKRFRGGTTLVGLTSSHETQPEGKRTPGFEALGRYVMGQPAYLRLLAAEANFCNTNITTFFDFDSEEEERYRWNNVRSWHLGVSTWVLDDCGWLRGS